MQTAAMDMLLRLIRDLSGSIDYLRDQEGVLVFSGEPTGEVLDSVKRHRAERARRVAGAPRRR